MNDYSLVSYAQEGEDILLKRIFEYRNINNGGFYVDVGAHHPQRFSNTYFFYKRGWKGINIDATPFSMKLFNELRESDINLEFAVSDKQETLTYYMFNEPALNSFDKELSLKRNLLEHYSILGTKNINTITLENILDKYLPKNQDIDFLSIDVEGFDFQVLKSNNWEKYKPKVVLIEILAKDIENMLNSEVYIYMKKLNYIYYAKSVHTHFFIKEDFFNFRFSL
ncbi:FkbM family methyltransferase [Aliarcobacter cryaerophilus]|uniref:FkbM family methyltransferase n=1 Tax=Aliarcobacter cryaerophilus TaxID=28198 RepID=UPI0011DF02AD|nr:FkbM family methyltransferase [Aliarcobacter cryaerophilus]QNM88290.1 FkbM family methyltransferase [Aliarcobacter cryaerophilus]